MTVKQPQDHKPKKANEDPTANREPFEWTSPDGVTITLPSAAMIPYGLIKRIRKLPADEQEDELIDAIADEETAAAIDDLPLIDALTMVKAWQESAGINLGESGASTDS